MRGIRLKLISAIAVGGILSAACGASGGGGAAEGEGDVVHIGVILPLTGSTAQNGNNSRKGIELAAELINQSGGIESMGGAMIQLDVADATSDPAKAASAATRFLTRGEPPVAIIGAYASSLTLTVVQVTERRQVPLLTTSFSDELTSKGYQYLFQLPAKASAVGRAQMKYAVEIAEDVGSPLDRAAVVYANNAYGESQAKGLREQAEELGIEVALFEGYSETISDAGPIAQKILGSEPDVIFAVSYVTDGVLLTRALRSRGNTAPIIGGVGGFITPDFKKALGQQVNGIFSVDTSDPDDYGELGQLYQDKYGELMPQEAHDNAAALYVIAQALEQNPTTEPQELTKTLRDGVFDMGAAGSMPGGKVDFDDSGANVHARPLMVQWQDGQLVGVWPSDITDHTAMWTS